MKLRVEQLWLVVILAGFGFYVALVPLVPNDFWWHLKAGEIIVTTGRIPTTNLFAWTLPRAQPYVYGAWLAEALFYGLYRLGGLALPMVARTVLVVTAFTLVALEARRRSASWRIAALVLIPLCLMTLNNLLVRTQNWAWLPFVGFLLILTRYREGRLAPRWLLLLPLLLTFWVNVHGSWILGPVLLGLTFFGEGVRYGLRRPDALPRSRLLALLGTGVLCALALLVNPQGIGIVGYVYKMMTDAPSQTLVVEWQSPAPTGIANSAFYATVLLGFGALLYSRYRPPLTEALTLAAFLWLAWSGQRYVIWFGMVAVPVLAQALAEGWPRLRRGEGGRPQWINTLLALMLFLPVLAAQPWWVERLPLPDSYWALVWRGREPGPLIGVETPLAAADYLRAHPGGCLFNEMGYGSYLIWAVPEQGVFIDPRVELYPLEQWQDYIRISQGVRYQALLDKYGVTRILLDRELQPGLAEVLPADPAWELEYQDSRAEIWRKIGASGPACSAGRP